MKVLGLSKGKYGDAYIAEVSHRELEQFLNRYYKKPPLERLKVGEEINLGEGYDYKVDADEIYRKISAVFGDNNETLTALNRAVNLIGQSSPESKQEG